MLDFNCKYYDLIRLKELYTQDIVKMGYPITDLKSIQRYVYSDLMKYYRIVIAIFKFKVVDHYQKIWNNLAPVN